MAILVRRAANAPMHASAFRSWLHEAVSSSFAPYVALAVGDSTLPLYSGLPMPDPAWNGKCIIPLDELVPAPRDPEFSFSRRLARALPEALRPLLSPITPGPDAGQSAAQLGTAVERDGLAVCVLGLGPDGHIAFNQPGSTDDAPTRVVEIAPENLERLGDVAPATHAITLGVRTILRAHAIALVVDGPGKTDAVRRALEGPEGADAPVSWLRKHPNVVVFVNGNDQ
ncbi:MAG: 6-phosphogluconolactonase [Actinomycetota bacterium]